MLGTLDGSERCVAGEGTGPDAVLHLPAQRSDARLRDDVDEEGAGVVIFRREAVARDVDRFDLRLRRQRRSFEAVDADDRRASRHLLQLLAQHGGIVRQRLDLLARQRRSERRRAIDGDFLFVARDGDRVGDLLDGERERLAILARADADVGIDARLEAGELGFDGIAARRQALENSDSLGRRRDGGRRRRLRALVNAGNRDGGSGQHAASLIDDRHLQAPVARLALGHAGAGQHERRRDDCGPHGSPI